MANIISRRKFLTDALATTAMVKLTPLTREAPLQVYGASAGMIPLPTARQLYEIRARFLSDFGAFGTATTLRWPDSIDR